jgi:hypothetical protein
VLTLLVLQASFLVPPMGYAVLMVRHRIAKPIRTGRFVRALSPYLVAQLVVLALVLAYPQSVWRGPAEEAAPPVQAPATTIDESSFPFQQDFELEMKPPAPPGQPEASHGDTQ